jgi:hypothetical protein
MLPWQIPIVGLAEVAVALKETYEPTAEHQTERPV